MNTRTMITLLALGAFAAASCAADESPAQRFAWLSGHWCSQQGESRIDEYWLPAGGDLALGVGRTVKAGKVSSYEYMRIETRDGLTNYISLHDGQPATAFRLTAAGADWARFENPQHDFPKRIEYRRNAAGLHAEIAGPGRDGKELVIGFEYLRCAD